MREEVYIPQIGDRRITKVYLRFPETLKVHYTSKYEKRHKEEAYILQQYRRKFGICGGEYGGWTDECWTEPDRKYPIPIIDLTNEKDYSWLMILCVIGTAVYFLYDALT